jgi:hypothetical protein
MQRNDDSLAAAFNPPDQRHGALTIAKRDVQRRRRDIFIALSCFRLVPRAANSRLLRSAPQVVEAFSLGPGNCAKIRLADSEFAEILFIEIVKLVQSSAIVPLPQKPADDRHARGQQRACYT